MSTLSQGAAVSDSDAVVILYRNWRNETAVRRIVPGSPNPALVSQWFGSSEWHPEPQWLFSAFDVEKGAYRDFARAGVLAWGQEAVDAALATLAAPASPGVPEEVRRAMQHAITQARGALFLDAMVDGDGKPFGTTTVAMEALNAAEAVLLAAPTAGRVADGGDGGPWPEQYASLADGYGPVEEWRDWTKQAERDPLSPGALHALRGLVGEFAAPAILSGAEPAVGGEKWRPISTAPKDGTLILLYGTLKRSLGAPTWYIGKWYVFRAHEDGWWVSSCVEVIATAWAPLPATPPTPGGAR